MTPTAKLPVESLVEAPYGGASMSKKDKTEEEEVASPDLLLSVERIREARARDSYARSDKGDDSADGGGSGRSDGP